MSVEALRQQENVVIPEGTEKIVNYLFRGSRIKSVEIPASVEEIGAGAFYGCGWLKKVVFRGAGTDAKKSKLKIIEEDAFCDCCDLENVELPAGLEEIGLCAFEGSGLRTVTAPPSVRVIHQGAFCKCKSLRKVVLNEGLEVLGTDERIAIDMGYYGVFEKSAVEEVVLPSTLKRIEYSAFEDCGHLKDAVLPEGLEYIGN